MIEAKNDSSGNYEMVPEGSHVARIYQIVHLGHIEGYEGKIENKVRITFELPNELREFKEGEGEKPMSISKDYTLNTHEKANLRKLINAVKTLTDEEVRSFNVEDLMGQALLITIIHQKKKSGDGSYAKVESEAPLVKGMEVPEAINEEFIFNYTDKFDESVVENFPDFIKEKIKSSIEYPQAVGADPFDDFKSEAEAETTDPDSVKYPKSEV